jgi:hypothetical protein
MERARSSSLAGDEARAERLRRARLAVEVGDCLRDPLEPLPHGHATVHAAEAYRQALFWARSLHDGVPSSAAEDVPYTASAAVAGDVSLDDANAFARLAELPFEEQQAATSKLRTEALQALGPFDAADTVQRQVGNKRRLRVGLIVIATALLAVLVAAAVPREKNLAQRASWRASSALAECRPDIGECGGVRTRIFFHTKEETDPWIEYDLGTPQRVTRVIARNRSDFGPERAVPLAVEVSLDGKSYREVARKQKPFAVWEASFPAVQARYVRLRARAKTFLHLEQVLIRP